MYRSAVKLARNVNLLARSFSVQQPQLNSRALITIASCKHNLALNNFQQRRLFSSETLEKEFQTAVASLQKVNGDVDNEQKLKLYALYKQATNGPCAGEKPSMFNAVEKAKWQAWSSLGELSSEEAKKNYISIVGELIAAAGPAASSAEEEPGLVFESKDHVYWIKLNRPKQYNAITREMYDGIVEALKRAGEDPEVKFVVLTGTGKYFSSGNDLSKSRFYILNFFITLLSFRKLYKGSSRNGRRH